MDIQDIHNRFDISVKKLRRMEREGVLRVGKSLAAPHWQRVRSEIRKGKMTARSVALAYRFPERLSGLMRLTAGERQVVEEHFREAELPVEISSLPELSKAGPNLGTLIYFVLKKEYPYFTIIFINMMKKVIPAREVGYLYVAVRLLLTCETDSEIASASEQMSRGLLTALDNPSMKGWSHRERTAPGKRRIIYHQPPASYDL